LRADEDDSWFGLGSSIVARIVTGEDVASVAVEAAQLGRDVGREFRSDFPYDFGIRSLQELTVGSFDETGRTLMVGAFLLMLIACTNLANLSLTRRVDREQEMSLRTALGAGHGRIVRLVALENGVVALVGSVLGPALAYAAVEALQAVSPGGIPRLGEVGVDLRVAAFAARWSSRRRESPSSY
jgi:predicted lysophospholipase L1 biosynthesis ABC-type transport system permease subunit